MQEARAAVANFLVLHPHAASIPPLDVAEVILDELGREFQFKLSSILVRAFIVEAIRAERRKEAGAKRAQSLLPGFEHLPIKIHVAEGARLRLLDANTFGVREYYRLLMKGHRNRKRNDPRVKEAKALLEKMQKASKADKGITVREVLKGDD